jgi:hypothetical protein
MSTHPTDCNCAPCCAPCICLRILQAVYPAKHSEVYGVAAGGPPMPTPEAAVFLDSLVSARRPRRSCQGLERFRVDRVNSREIRRSVSRFREDAETHLLPSIVYATHAGVPRKGEKQVGYRDTSEIVNEELPESKRCMWQITPKEMPKDMPPMALELWMDVDGKLVFFQFFIDRYTPKRGATARTSDDWYKHILGYARFDQVK